MDLITDFSSADDAIYLSRPIFEGMVAGALSSTAFVQGTSAADADDRIIYDSATGSIFHDADGSGAGATVLFATVSAGTILTSADFIAY